MRTLLVSLISLFLFVGMSSFKTNANELQLVKVSITANNQRVKNVFNQIEQKAGYSIVYEQGVIDLNQKIDINETDCSVDEILDKVLAQTGNSYLFVNNQIIITRKTKEIKEVKQAPAKLTGLIVDEKDEPVIGASVVIKGSSTGTFSDMNGKFTMDMPTTNTKLSISYLGYKTHEVTINNQQSLNVKLMPEDAGLDEIVVIGYGVVRKRDLTGSVGSIKANDIVSVPASNPMAAIQGKISGVDIVKQSGVAGAGVDIKIRGTRSINAHNSPLFIIDGLQGGSFEDVNSGDIQSIEILKDASSTAIYGSQGANGVVIITTKKGESGKTRVSYDGYYGVNGVAKYPAPLMGDAYLKMRRDAGSSAGTWSSVKDDINIFSNAELMAIEKGQWVNWVDEVMETGSQQSHQVSVRGGNEKTKAFASLSYYNEKGLFFNDQAKRYTLRTNVDYEINKYVKTGFYSQFAYWDRNDRKSWVLSNANQALPLGTPYDENGNIVLKPTPTSSEKNLSPLADNIANKAVDNTIKLNTSLSGYVEIKPASWINFRSQAGATINFDRNGVYNDKESIAQYANPINQASIANSNSRFFTWDNIVNLNKKFNDHSFNLTALTSYTEKKEDNATVSGIKQIISNHLFYNLNATEATSREVYSGYVENATMSYAARVNYSFKEKYLLTASLRADGASQLAVGNKWHSFPSLALAWRLGDETFMKKYDFLSDLKIRASYGVTGNAAIRPFETQSIVTPGDKMGFGENTAFTYKYGQVLGNKDLSWERSAVINGGIDLSILRNRISMTIDYYQTKTKDLLMLRKLSSASGGDGKVPFDMWQNVGETQNKGLEITLNTVNIESKKGFNWTSALTFTTNKEKVISLYQGDIILDETTSLLIGYPVKPFYGYKKQGIWQLDEAALAAQYTHSGIPFKPGDIKIQNVQDAEGKLNEIDKENDWTYLGQPSPKWIMGFNNNFAYKNFDFNAYMFIRWGQMIDYALAGRYNPTGEEGQPGNYDYWTPDNPSNDYPAADSKTPLINYFGYNSLRYIDGSFLKIKTLSLGYTLPKTLTSKFMVDKLRVYCTANNVFTKAKSHLLKDYDPERGGAETYPMGKQFIFGINIEF